MALAFSSALLKLSGEALGGDKGFGFDTQVLEALATEVREVHAMGVRLSLVVGGGNIIRGATASRDVIVTSFPDLGAPTGDPEHYMHAIQLADSIERALTELPVNCRRIFVWQEIEGLTQAEIAERMNGDDEAETQEDEIDETAEIYEAEPKAEAEAYEASPVVQIAPPIVVPVTPAALRRASRVRAAPGSKGKAAFTLRLDPERHLKLRLACAVDGRSAQQLVTDALDQLLERMPDLNGLAAKAKRRG